MTDDFNVEQYYKDYGARIQGTVEDLDNKFGASMGKQLIQGNQQIFEDTTQNQPQSDATPGTNKYA